MLSFFSSRPNWDSPTPLHAGECVPSHLPSLVPGGRAHSLRERGWGESQFRRGDIHCGTLDVLYMYFVVLGLNYWVLSLDIQDSMFVKLESGTILFVYSQRRGLDEGSLQYLPVRLRRNLSQAGLIYRSCSHCNYA